MTWIAIGLILVVVAILGVSAILAVVQILFGALLIGLGRLSVK